MNFFIKIFKIKPWIVVLLTFLIFACRNRSVSSATSSLIQEVAEAKIHISTYELKNHSAVLSLSIVDQMQKARIGDVVFLRVFSHPDATPVACENSGRLLRTSCLARRDKYCDMADLNLSSAEVWPFVSLDPSAEPAVARKGARENQHATVCIYSDQSGINRIFQATVPVFNHTWRYFNRIGAQTYSNAVEYGEECAREIGYLPEFSCVNPKYTREIPVTVRGEKVTTPQAECDNPSWFGMSDGNCFPYSRVGKLNSYADPTLSKELKSVDTVFLCRRLRQVEDPLDPIFEDVAMIQHDRITGKTCFFQSLATDFAPKDASHIVPPHSKATSKNPLGSAHRFWLAPFRTDGFACTTCHDGDPFVHSPFIDQVKDEVGMPFIPSRPFGKYVLVGSKFPFKKVNIQWSEGAMNFRIYNWPDVFTVKHRADETCTSCHRIGDQRTCEDFLWFSVGLGNRGFHNLHTRDDDARRLARPLGVLSEKWRFPFSYTMPPGHNAQNQDDWRRLYGEGFQKIASCCAEGARIYKQSECVFEHGASPRG